MSMQPDEVIEGRSPLGVSMAMKDAVEKYEDKHGKPENGETLTLRVVDVFVEFENPVRDYIVHLGPTG